MYLFLCEIKNNFYEMKEKIFTFRYYFLFLILLLLPSSVNVTSIIKVVDLFFFYLNENIDLKKIVIICFLFFKLILYRHLKIEKYANLLIYQLISKKIYIINRLIYFSFSVSFLIFFLFGCFFSPDILLFVLYFICLLFIVSSLCIIYTELSKRICFVLFILLFFIKQYLFLFAIACIFCLCLTDFNQYKNQYNKVTLVNAKKNLLIMNSLKCIKNDKFNILIYLFLLILQVYINVIFNNDIIILVLFYTLSLYSTYIFYCIKHIDVKYQYFFINFLSVKEYRKKIFLYHFIVYNMINFLLIFLFFNKIDNVNKLLAFQTILYCFLSLSYLYINKYTKIINFIITLLFMRGYYVIN